MFGFGCVRTHLGVVFSEAFGLLWVFGWISEKKGRNQQIWANFGVLRHDVRIPRSTVGPRRGVALFTDRCFYHVFLFHYSENLSIGPYECMKGSIHVCKVKEKLDRTSPPRRV